MIIVSFISFFLLILEELFHRLNKAVPLMNIDLTDDSFDRLSNGNPSRITRLLVWIRIGQLLVFGVLFALIAALSGMKVLYTTPGQLAGLILMIQVVRIANRRIIKQWAVLGSAVFLQVILLILLILTGLTTITAHESAFYQTDWVLSSLSFIVLFMLSLSFPLVCTYFIRLFAREGSNIYYFFPPLAFSEYWIRRIIRTTVWIALAAFLFHLFLVLQSGNQAGPAILHLVLTILLFTSVFLFRNKCRLHHPFAFALIIIAWIVNISWLLT
jgi:hypothetical protein